MKLHKLTPKDMEILNAIKNVVDGIATMYGSHTEVVLHSLDRENPSVIKIANGHITGRGVGAPITNLALEKLKRGLDISETYLSQSGNGKTLKSITTVIRNEKQMAIGLLCINTDMDAPLMSVLHSMLPQQCPLTEHSSTSEVFAVNIEETLHSTIDKVNQEVRHCEKIPSSKKNREIVARLFDAGIFELKDSAQVAAKRLDISVHTIYRYLRELKAPQE
ncbi:helix-turn-helix transcriptional regulator [Shewanella chilikensis]|uniref:helix-turn-helix transcriptional regulator n=1 Tax=Shewanella chilikensis TaxID=558541 RepID=UPI001F19BB1B|nr:PAS domain-containing protein [Shewanella chilikensis]MCE9787162.1 PAS domain-containing protein [Shewanella chilikensis]